MIELIYLLIFLVVIFSIGRKIIRLFRLKLTKIEEFLISTAIGSGVLMCLTFFLGLVGLLYKEVYLILIFLVVLFSLKEIVYLGYLIKTLFINNFRRFKFNLSGFLLAIFVFFIVINLITVFAPVFEWDSVSYHLAFAKNYVRHNSLIVQPSQLYTYMPHGMSMFYVISELFYPATFSALIAFLFNVLGGIGIYSVIKKNHSEVSALIGSLVFLTLPAVIERLNQPLIDLSLTYFFICAVIIFLKYIEEKDDRIKSKLILVLSFLIGICLFIKLTAVFLLASLTIAILFDKIIYRKKHSFKHIMVLLVISFIFLSPWLIRAYTYTGNPVYPFSYSIFGGEYLEDYRSKQYAEWHKKMGMERNPINALLTLWNVTFRNDAFSSVLGITPFYVIVIPLVLFFYKDIKNLREWMLLFITSMTIMTIIFWVHPVIRYMFPALALLSVLTGKIIDVMIKEKVLKWVLIICLLISLTFNLAIWWGINSKNVYFLVSSQTKEEFYSKLKDYNPALAMQWINENTPKDSKILLAREIRGYYLDRNYVVNDPSLSYIDYYSMDGAEDLIKRLKKLKISYILINEGSLYKPELHEYYHISWNLIRDAVSNMTLVYNESQIMVYRV